MTSTSDSRKSAGSKTSHTGMSTQSVHAGEARQKPGDSITDPIFCSSTYTFPDTQSVIDFIEHSQPREEYGRYGSPGERVVEKKLAALDGGEEALLFSSGMAAIVGVLMAKLRTGDEVIFFNECYQRSREFCAKHLTHLVFREFGSGQKPVFMNCACQIGGNVLSCCRRAFHCA